MRKTKAKSNTGESNSDKRIFLQYTNPESVHKIMDVIGTKGVNNSPEGLYIIRDEQVHLKLKKREWLVVDGSNLSVMTNANKKALYK